MVPIVCEYPEVFPEDILGLPPARGIEFYINLVLGTTPISKVPYHVTPIKLAKLKS